jgi:crossover junction endodeoxyribonuclease RusA
MTVATAKLCSRGDGNPVHALELCNSCYATHRRSGRLTDSGYFPAVDVRRHVAKLQQAGMTGPAIARAAGVSPTTIHNLTAPAEKAKRVRKQNAERILAIQPPSISATNSSSFVIDLPWPRPLLNSNSMPIHPHARGRLVRQVQRDVMLLARHHKIPNGRHLTIQLHYAPGSWQRMDSHNLHPTVKAAVDALARPARKLDPRKPAAAWIGLSLVPDDTDEYVTILAPQIVRPPTPGPRCWLTIEVEK